MDGTGSARSLSATGVNVRRRTSVGVPTRGFDGEIVTVISTAATEGCTTRKSVARTAKLMASTLCRIRRRAGHIERAWSVGSASVISLDGPGREGICRHVDDLL